MLIDKSELLKDKVPNEREVVQLFGSTRHKNLRKDVPESSQVVPNAMAHFKRMLFWLESRLPDAKRTEYCFATCEEGHQGLQELILQADLLTSGRRNFSKAMINALTYALKEPAWKDKGKFCCAQWYFFVCSTEPDAIPFLRSAPDSRRSRGVPAHTRQLD